MSERKANQTYSYTGSIEYSFDNIILDSTSDLALNISKIGFEGLDSIPYDGAVVTLRTGDVGTLSDVKDLQPSLNNGFYYLVTDEDYSNSSSEDIIALATAVPSCIVAGKYEGTFTFSNPNNYSDLYLIYDYKDSIVEGLGSYTGGEVTKYIELGFGSNIGVTGVDYVITDTPTRITLYSGTTVIATSKYVGLNSTANYNALIAAGVAADDIALSSPYDGTVNNGTGELVFKKTSAANDYTAIVDSPLASTSWTITTQTPALKSFYIDTTSEPNPTDACANCPTTLYYHNGLGDMPVPGDTIFTVSNGATVFVGADSFFAADTVTCGAPPAVDAIWLKISDLGTVSEQGVCKCPDDSVPFITQGDVNVSLRDGGDIVLQAAGNVDTWTISTTCLRYNIEADDKGCIFEYTSCDGKLLNISMGVNSTRDICSTTTPVALSGTATITASGNCNGENMPTGLSLNASSGLISGTASSTGEYPLTLTATNCAGDSATKTITLTVTDESTAKIPFYIADKEPKDTGDAACALSPFSCIIMYHSGNTAIPTKGDIIWTDTEFNVFNGLNQWYYLTNSLYSVKVDSTGKVVEENSCPVSTTTTTTTTSTTTTTTLPAGNYYTATLCSDVTVSTVLLDTTLATIVATNIVKTIDGTSWTVTAATTATYPYLTIENPVVIYADCNTAQGITTTTTTTTTTTAKVYTAFNMDNTPDPDSYSACTTGTASTGFWHDGSSAYPVVNDFVYTSSGGPVLAGNGCYFYIFNVSAFALRISATGQVLEVYNCTGATTTTTTATPTIYYDVEDCDTSSPFIIESTTSIANGTVVKADDGICYTIIRESHVGPSIATILFQYTNCLDCVGVTTTTTTTAAPTTTSTTTTTTTTTTAAPLSRVLMNYHPTKNSDACTGSIVEIWTSDIIGGSFLRIYADPLGGGEAATGFYKVITGSIVYEYEKNTGWLFDTYTCP